ncbi:MAG: helix-turn-helix transcriptional regulator [Blautia sp.]|nr:helix-turn-helix transcriptional regulator [Blautia sp.]
MIRRRVELAEKRRKKKIPQFVVASELGISQAAYSCIESGYRNPSEEVAERLREMFQLPDNYFDVQSPMSSVAVRQ